MDKSTEISFRIRKVISELFGESILTITEDSNFIDSISDYTSLSSLNMISKLEDEFDIEVDFVADDVMFSFANIKNISLYVEEKLEDKKQ